MAAPPSPALPTDDASVANCLSTGTLRDLLDARRAERRVLSLEEASAIVVPLCLDVQARHARGDVFLLHPSCVEAPTAGSAQYIPRANGQPFVPEDPRDRACLPPELCATLAPGGSRASVFSIGAILYECVTGTSVGPAMARPRDIDASLPEALEILLAKALIGDPAHRPDDLGALASALYHLAPKHSIHPPDVDEGNLDHGEDFEVDIRLSLLPPAATPAPDLSALRPARIPIDAYGQVEVIVPAARPSAPSIAEHLASLKRRLESDPRPRYVVNKDRMDHGPFSAVELLQQIASNGFVAEDVLRDELSGQTRPIAEWEEFEPFSKQAELKREVIEEQRVVEQVAKAEKKAGVAKSTIGVILVAAMVGGVAIWFFTAKGFRNEGVQVENDSLLDMALDGGIRGQKKLKHGAHGGPGGGVAGPGGMSYDQALAANPQQIVMGAHQGTPDLTDTQLSAPMRNAAFLDACGTPNSMHVTVKTVVKMGARDRRDRADQPAERGHRGLHRPLGSQPDVAGEPQDRLVRHDLLRPGRPRLGTNAGSSRATGQGQVPGGLGTQKPRLLQAAPATQSTPASTHGKAHLPYRALQRDIPHAVSSAHGKAAGPGTAMASVARRADADAAGGGIGAEAGTGAWLGTATVDLAAAAIGAATGVVAWPPRHEASGIETSTARAPEHRRMDMTSMLRLPRLAGARRPRDASGPSPARHAPRAPLRFPGASERRPRRCTGCPGCSPRWRRRMGPRTCRTGCCSAR